MRLLLRRGPLHIQNPEPLAAEQVATAITFVFDRLAEPTGRDGFCWADQIRSPGALRDHLIQLRQAAKRLGMTGRSATELQQARQLAGLVRIQDEARHETG